MSKRSEKLVRPFESEAVAETFNAYPPKIRKRLIALRSLIFETADKTEGVGALEETLKWGEPAYLTSKSKSGSTVRANWLEEVYTFSVRHVLSLSNELSGNLSDIVPKQLSIRR